MDDRALGSMLRNITSKITVLQLTLDQSVIPELKKIEEILDRTVKFETRQAKHFLEFVKETEKALNDEAKQYYGGE